MKGRELEDTVGNVREKAREERKEGGKGGGGVGGELRREKGRTERK